MLLKPLDIHNHLLPGVDDGFLAAEESLKAIGILLESGVKELVFTPHINPDVFPNMNEYKIRHAYDCFQPLLPSGLETSLAAEYMIHSGFEKKIAGNTGNLLCYKDRSILVEMSYYYRSSNLEETLFELQMAGFKPILAHPERYLYMADRLEDFDRLHENGCRFQLNYISFTGAYGLGSMKIIRYLAKRGHCDFVATDLHSLNQLKNILANGTSLLLKWPFTRYLNPEQIP